MRIKEEVKSGIMVLTLEGDFISLPDQDKLRGRVTELVKRGILHLIIDLKRVKYINSCGLGSLVCAFTSMRRAGGDLRLSRVGPLVRELLSITQLNQVFKVYPSITKALAEARVHEN